MGPKKKKVHASAEISRYSRKAESLTGSSQSATLELGAHSTDSPLSRGEGDR